MELPGHLFNYKTVCPEFSGSRDMATTLDLEMELCIEDDWVDCQVLIPG